MSLEAAVAIVWDVLRMAVVPVERQFGYVISSKSYAQDLQREVRMLEYAAAMVCNVVDEARNNCRNVYSRVTVWQENAEKALEEARELLGEFEKASKTCCCGTLPDPKCRYQFSRKAKDKIDAIRLLALERIEFRKLDDISFIDPALGNVAAPIPARREGKDDILSTTATASPRIERGLHLLSRAVTAIKHVISSEIYAQDLQKEVGKLAYEFDWVDLAVKEANKDHPNVYNFVSNWQESADKALEEARNLLGRFKKASKTWCRGTLPDPRCHYEFSTKAEAQTKVVRELAQQCIAQFKEVNNISMDTARGKVELPPAASSASTSITPREDGVFESRALMIQKVMDALANNSNSVVGIYGMGGVGKSTLLVDVEKRIRKDNSFDWVARADVSENRDIKRIQGEIAHWLGLSDIKTEENVSLRADLLRSRLEKEEGERKKVLIILDNLWERLDLKSVGIPCGDDNKARGCKLLLTSRDLNVLRGEMRCDRAFLLGELEKEEAKRLFEKMVGGKVPVDLEPLVEEALRISAGLPFLIVAISKLLIDTSYSNYVYALEQIWNEETDELINRVLELSYDRISETEKSFLQLCVVYGGSEPSLENLMKHGVSLGLFPEDSSMEEARHKWRSLIRTLQDSSLLLDSDEVDRFKIHDIVRKFVISVTSRDHRLLVLNDKEKSVTECLRA